MMGFFRKLEIVLFVYTCISLVNARDKWKEKRDYSLVFLPTVMPCIPRIGTRIAVQHIFCSICDFV